MDRYRKMIFVEFENQLSTGLFNPERERTIEQLKQAAFPNLLAEMVYSADLDSGILAQAANISTNVFYEVLRGKDSFTFDEKLGIHHTFSTKRGYGGFGYLYNSKLNFYDLSRKKHKRKVQQLLFRFSDALGKVSELQKNGKLTDYNKWRIGYNSIMHGGILSHPKKIYKSGIFLRAEYNMMEAFIKRVDAVLIKMGTEEKQTKPIKRTSPLEESGIAV